MGTANHHINIQLIGCDDSSAIRGFIRTMERVLIVGWRRAACVSWWCFNICHSARFHQQEAFKWRSNLQEKFRKDCIQTDAPWSASSQNKWENGWDGVKVWILKDHNVRFHTGPPSSLKLHSATRRVERQKATHTHWLSWASHSMEDSWWKDFSSKYGNPPTERRCRRSQLKSELRSVRRKLLERWRSVFNEVSNTWGVKWSELIDTESHCPLSLPFFFDLSLRCHTDPKISNLSCVVLLMIRRTTWQSLYPRFQAIIFIFKYILYPSLLFFTFGTLSDSTWQWISHCLLVFSPQS